MPSRHPPSRSAAAPRPHRKQHGAGLQATPPGYPELLTEIKTQVAAARTRALLAINSELIVLYWQIGAQILTSEQQRGWGAKVIDRLSADLRREMPLMSGLSPRNLRYMRDLARAWGPALSREEMLQQPVARLPWGHNIVLLDKLEDEAERTWYATKAVQHGWSRKVLVAEIASRLRERQGGALTSFASTLPERDSELLADAIKDPYNFEFLCLPERAKERDLEQALLSDVQSFLMEMGEGFALAGRQFLLRVPDVESGEEQEFYLDLLFYNYLLRRFVAIDLKIETFKPEFAGKMSFYLSAIDELHRQPDDKPSIGLILCPGRNRTVTEWALRGIETPVAVARYLTDGTAFSKEAPRELRPALPALPELAEQLRQAVHEQGGQTSRPPPMSGVRYLRAT